MGSAQTCQCHVRSTLRRSRGSSQTTCTQPSAPCERALTGLRCVIVSVVVVVVVVTVMVVVVIVVLAVVVVVMVVVVTVCILRF
jgi:Flp pilus assembly protein TadB